MRCALVTIDPEMKDRFKVTFDGKEVVSPHWSEIRVCNAGGVAIAKGDFETPVTFELAATVIATGAYEPKPAELAPQIKVTGKVVHIEPLLLNSGDSFKLALVTDGEPGSPVLKGRIIGGDLRALASGPPRIVAGAFFVAVFAMVLGFALVILAAVRDALKQATLAGVVKFLVVALIVVPSFMVIAVVLERRAWPDRLR